MTETGDRAAILARLRAGTASAPPVNHAHPAPAPDPAAPAIGFRTLADGRPLSELFIAAATASAARVGMAIADVVAEHGIRTAVATAEPEVTGVVADLVALGVTVGDAGDRDAAVSADLGVTACRAAVAVTGSVVLGSDVPGARWASLLPRVHLCVVPVDRIVATPGDILRRLSQPQLPAALCFITGPSRTGDIEQLLTLGVHGPLALHLLLC